MSTLLQDFYRDTDSDANQREWDHSNETFLEYLCDEFDGPDLGMILLGEPNGITVTNASARLCSCNYTSTLTFKIISLDNLRTLRQMFDRYDWSVEFDDTEISELLKSASKEDAEEIEQLVIEIERLSI